MPSKRSKAKESPAVYHTKHQVTAPKLPSQEMDAARAKRRAKAWRELDALLAQIHARTQDMPLEEIEVDITAARQEVQEQSRPR